MGVGAVCDLSGDSAVTGYEIGARSIAVEFQGDRVYEYTYASAGAASVERMKELARAGRGLSTFISRVVREKYARRVR